MENATPTIKMRFPGLAEMMRLPAFRDTAAEQAFWQHHDAQMYHLRLMFLVFSLVIFMCFGFLDARTGGDSAALMVAIRSIAAMIMLVGIISFALPYGTLKQRENAIEICAFATAISTILLLIIAPKETANHYQFGLGVIVSVGALMLTPRFQTTTRVVVITMGVYLLTVPWHSGTMIDNVVHTLYNLLVAIAVLVGSFERERLVRVQAVMGEALAHTNAELRESQQAAIRARDKEIAANCAKNQFLASVSHELRTPMNAILGFSGMIRSEVFGPETNPKYAEYIEHIHNSGLLLQTNIDDLLDLARLESGKIGWVDETFSLDTALDNVLATCRVTAKEAGIALVLSNDAPNLVVNADPTRIAQATINLVTNAVKFSDPGQEVRIRVERDAAGTCRLHVADAGCGMAPEHLERVCVPFAQAHADSYSKGKGGLGLGLAIVSGITAMMEGRFELTSKEGVGTTATLVIPAHRIVTALSRAA